MKSLLIVLISMSMILPTTIFANSNRSVASTTDIKGLISKVEKRIANISTGWAKDGWTSSVINRSRVKSERRMTNNKKGLAIKIVTIKSKGHLKLIVGVLKTKPANINSVFTNGERLGQMRFVLDLNKLKTEKGRLDTITDFNKRSKTLERMIRLRLMEEKRKTSFVSNIVNFIIPTASAENSFFDINCIGPMFTTVIGGVTAIIIGRYIVYSLEVLSAVSPHLTVPRPTFRNVLKHPVVIVGSLLLVLVLTAHYISLAESSNC